MSATELRGLKMLITRKSPFTGKIHTMEINVTHAQIAAWENGKPIQNVMPNVSADHREFLMTGITPDEWNATFKNR